MTETTVPTTSGENVPILVKILAIAGFFASIALMVWLVVFGMRTLPGAFESLSGSFATIKNYREPTELSIATGKNIVNSKESFTAAWTAFSVPGTYTFSYACTEGVSLDVRSNDTITTLTCAEPTSFSNDITTIDVIASSEKNRFVDIPFSVGFTSTDKTLQFEKEGRITVVNVTIPQGGLATTEATDTDTEETTSEPTTPEVVAPTPAPEVATPAVTTPRPATYFPTSDPNGFTDLEVTYLGIGRVENGHFVPSGTFDEDSRGVLRFMVKNTGTKTSDTFTYEIDLPGNETYESRTELPLKPNERAFFTAAFEVPEKDSSETVSVSTDTDRDSNHSNNSFDWFVKISE